MRVRGCTGDLSLRSGSTRERMAVADKRCENGHFIDESWDLCPYCPQAADEPEIPVVRPSRVQDANPRTAVPIAPARPVAAAVPLGPRPVTATGHIATPMERTVAVQKIAPDELQPHRY